MNETSETIQQIIRRQFPMIIEKELQEEIAQVGKILQFKAGQTIMDYGSYIKLVPLVINGSIKVIREDDSGSELLLYFLDAGQSCSMSFTCCMMNKRSMIRTVAEEDTTLIGIPIDYMDPWMVKYQSWKNFVMLSYDNRMTELVRTIDSIAFQKMDERLLDYLTKKASITGSKILEATHQDIATDLNASREAISRLLKSLERSGQVKLSRNKVELIINGK